MYQCLKCGNSKLCCDSSTCKHISTKKMQHMISVDNLVNGAISNTLDYYKINLNGNSCCQCKYCKKIFESDMYFMYHFYYNCELLDTVLSKY